MCTTSTWSTAGKAIWSNNFRESLSPSILMYPIAGKVKQLTHIYGRVIDGDDKLDSSSYGT